MSSHCYVCMYAHVQLYVAACPDLTIRIFNEHFELIDTVHVTATVLCLSFNEATSELYTGGVGGYIMIDLRMR